MIDIQHFCELDNLYIMLNDGNHFQLDEKIVVAFIVTFGAKFLQFLKWAQLT